MNECDRKNSDSHWSTKPFITYSRLQVLPVQKVQKKGPFYLPIRSIAFYLESLISSLWILEVQPRVEDPLKKHS